MDNEMVAEVEEQYLDKSEFMLDLQVGLSKPRKEILSKYFYDELGSELFNQITRHPDYYLTACEIEILNKFKNQIAQLFNQQDFNLVELGPGEGRKAQILIDELILAGQNFSYLPIDISKKYLKIIMNVFRQKLNADQLQPICADYFRGLEWLQKHSKRTNLVLFLGSSIGNFSPLETQEFLLHLHDSLNKDDYVLLGFDLRKDVDILLQAYSDDAGITRDFNLNLLHRINREFNANFDLKKFQHYATYNVYSGAMESYLLSLERQIIKIDDMEQSFIFEEIEPIHVEYSHKFTIKQINEFAQKTGFDIIQNYSDERKFFVDALWRVK